MALGASLEGSGSAGIPARVILVMREGIAHTGLDVYRMLAHLSEEITRRTAEMVGIETTG